MFMNDFKKPLQRYLIVIVLVCGVFYLFIPNLSHEIQLVFRDQPKLSFTKVKGVTQDMLVVSGVVYAGSIDDFKSAMERYPNTSILCFKKVVGNMDELINIALGREIHQRRLKTVLLKGGSLDAGALDLFLSGVDRVVCWPSNMELVNVDNPNMVDDNPTNGILDEMYLDYYNDVGVNKNFRQFKLQVSTDSIPDMPLMTKEHIYKYGIGTIID